MATKDKDTLKSYFQTGFKPTEKYYSDLIDSSLNELDDKVSSEHPVDVNNDVGFVTPKVAKMIIDTYAIRQVNNILPDDLGNVSITNILGTAGSITGTITKDHVVGLQDDLNSKISSSNIKTINNQTIIGTGNINIEGGSGQVKLIAIPSSAYTIPVAASPNAFPDSCSTIPLKSNKTYLFKGKYLIANGTSHTLSIGWAVSGLVITSMEYVAKIFSSNLNAFATPISQTQVSGIGIKVLNSSTASPTSTIEFEGVLRCTTGGTITPLIKFEPTTGTLSTMKVGSFIEFTEIGADTIQTIGF